MDVKPSTDTVIMIDGSYGEGGGQILRAGLVLSMLTGQPVQFNNIRARRPNPGLQPQHLTAVHAAATISQARVSGAIIGSNYLYFEPGPIEGGEFLFNVEEISGAGSAGSVILVAQTVLLPLALSGQSAQVTLLGGTHVGWSPGADYLTQVYLPALREMGIEAELITHAAGFYPRGGGQVVLRVSPATTPLRPIHWLERGAFKQITLTFTLSNLPEHILKRGQQSAETLIGLLGVRPDFKHQILPSRGFGLSLTLSARAEHGYAGFIRLGRRGVAIEQVVEEAWNEFVGWAKTRTAVDHFLADQLVLPALFADGPSEWTTSRPTSHLKTLLWLVHHFVKARTEITPLETQGVKIRVAPGEEPQSTDHTNNTNHTST